MSKIPVINSCELGLILAGNHYQQQIRKKPFLKMRKLLLIILRMFTM